MYLSVVNSFRVIRCLSQSISPKIAIFYHIFVPPGDAPGAIMLNVVWMESEFDAYKLFRRMYPSIFNSFPVIRTASAKNRRFHVPQPTFLFPLETPLRLSRNMLHKWKENSMLVKALAACTYLYSIVSELYDAYLSQCVLVQKSLFFNDIFVSAGDAPGAITLNVWMEREFDAYNLSHSVYPSILNSFPVIRTASAKNRRFHVPQLTFLFPLETPCDYHAVCCIDGKTIQCLPNPSQHVPIYLQ